MSKSWKKVIKGMKRGKTLEEATVSTTLAVTIKQRRFKTVQISTKQQQAIRRG